MFHPTRHCTWFLLCCCLLVTCYLQDTLLFAASTTAPTSRNVSATKTSPDRTKMRRRAVRRGFAWIKKYIEKHWKVLSTDGLCVLAELAVNDDIELKKQVITFGQQIAKRLITIFLEEDGIEDKDDLLEAIEVLGYADVLQYDTSKLLAKVKKELVTYNTAKKLLGVSLSELPTLSGEPLYDLLIDTYTLERASAHLSLNLRRSVTLHHVLRLLRQRTYLSFDQDKDPDKENAEDSAYLATHVVFVMNNYGQLRLPPSALPKVYPYVRRNFHVGLQNKDVELLAEFLDVLRTVGFDETNDKMVAQGTAFLLRTQKQDGSWGDWEQEKDPYDALHYTWCGVLGLRGRGFLKGTKFGHYIKRTLHKLQSPTTRRAAKR
ncbi:MAG TPA: hypothetical protein DCE42_30210 [Myxococcales bacterium]|nr:hypothetical protein [Deltaproteobacteria bacterium]MBU53690.1 hypothetical protein [Deltaproteobacteria bacterium]HAA59067.1 hypothetical protein [Myxococcales bacterium]